jgi:hypothetical protein
LAQFRLSAEIKRVKVASFLKRFCTMRRLPTRPDDGFRIFRLAAPSLLREDMAGRGAGI